MAAAASSSSAAAVDDQLLDDVDFLNAVSDAFAVDDGVPSARLVAMAARFEGPLLEIVDYMAHLGDDLRRRAASGDEEDDEQLLAEAAATAEHLRAQAAALAATARRMQEQRKLLLLMAEADNMLLDPNVWSELELFSRGMAEMMEAAGTTIPLDKRLEAATLSELSAVHVEGKMAEMVRRLRQGAAAALSGGHDEELVELLEERAEAAEEKRGEAKAIADTMRGYMATLGAPKRYCKRSYDQMMSAPAA